ncbi:MAG: oligosaccharide flippase family protein [Anaerolineales bacterium]|nr:oligosaccharide flippase family protein [Anaerolineales bacterium]
MRKKLFSDTLIYTTSQILLRLRGLLVLPLFARHIGAEGYGIFVQMMVAITLLSPLLGLKLETSAVRFLSAETDRDRFRSRFFSGLGVLLVVGTIWTVLFRLLASFGAVLLFGDDSLGGLVWVGCLVLLSSLTSSYLINYYRIVQRIKLQSVILFVQTVLETIGIFAAVLLERGVAGAFWALVLVDTVISLALFASIWRQLGIGRWDWAGVRQMLGYSLPLTPNGIMRWVVNYADRVIITQMLGLAILGTYGASYSLSNVLTLLVMPIGYVLFPLLSQAWDEGKLATVQNYLSGVTRYYILMSIPACVGLTMLSPLLLRYLASPDFVTDRLLIFWLVVGIALNGLFQINVYVFHLRKQTHFITGILLLCSTGNIALNLWLVPLMGMSGAALATAVTFLVMALAAILFGQRLIPYEISWPGMLKAFIAGLTMGGVAWLMPLQTVGAAIMAAIATTIVYFVVLLFLRGISPREVRQLWAMLPLPVGLQAATKKAQ